MSCGCAGVACETWRFAGKLGSSAKQEVRPSAPDFILNRGWKHVQVGPGIWHHCSLFLKNIELEKIKLLCHSSRRAICQSFAQMLRRVIAQLSYFNHRHWWNSQVQASRTSGYSSALPGACKGTTASEHQVYVMPSSSIHHYCDGVSIHVHWEGWEQVGSTEVCSNSIII